MSLNLYNNYKRHILLVQQFRQLMSELLSSIHVTVTWSRHVVATRGVPTCRRRGRVGAVLSNLAPPWPDLIHFLIHRCGVWLIGIAKSVIAAAVLSCVLSVAN